MISSLLALASVAPLASADLWLPTFISSNMVLQRKPQQAQLWGGAASGNTIEVYLDGAAVAKASADATGNFTVSLPAQPASLSPRSVRIVNTATQEQRNLTNVVFGDVFLCAGQSNMHFAVPGAFNASAEMADSANYPNLRLATAMLAANDTPQNDVPKGTPSHGAYNTSAWGVAGPDAFGTEAFSYFSAVCYFTGRDLYRAMDGKVPIGLVASDWGGQTVEAFSSPDALNDKTCGGTQPGGRGQTAVDNDTTDAKSADADGDYGGPVPNPGPSQLWNAMIYPFTKMRFVAALWYQGEANARDPPSYACRFPAMIADWRKKMGLRLPFYFVQLAACGDKFTELRNAQMVALKLPDVGYAVAIDIGDSTSPEGSIHPRRKQEVGRRLSLNIRASLYKETDVVGTGPVIDSVAPQGDTRITITYKEGTANNLHAHNTADCNVVPKVCCSQSPFEVQAANGTWAELIYKIEGEKIVASLPPGISASNMSAVRYDWTGWPGCAVYNGEGGPDDHKGIAGTPFCYNATTRSACPVGSQFI